MRGRIETILDWARVRKYRAGENPALWEGHLDHLLPSRGKVQKVGHHAALPYDEMGTFMKSLRNEHGVSARALEFAILTVARTGEAIGAKWPEIDFNKAVWIIPPERMKAGKEHRVPLGAAEAMSGFVLEWLRDDRIDLGILYLPVDDHELTSREILSEELRLFGPAATAQAFGSRTSLTFPESADLPLILLSSGHGLRDLLEERATAMSVTLNTEIDVDSYSSIKELLEKDLGYSILPVHAIEREVRQGRLHSCAIGSPPLTRSLYLVHAANRPFSNATQLSKMCVAKFFPTSSKQGDGRHLGFNSLTSH